MVNITVAVPEEVMTQLQPVQHDLAEILELGVREWTARRGAGFSGLAEVLEMLAALPTPEEVLALRPSPTLQSRIDYLLAKCRDGGLSADEQREWDHYEYVEHLVRLAKTQAALRLKGS